MFAQYAMASAEEALHDAGWQPSSKEDLENTVLCSTQCHKICRADLLQGVYIGSGIGNLDDAYDTAVAYEKGVSHIHVLA